MATQSAHHIALTPAVERDAIGTDDGIGDRIVKRIREMYCGLHGHDTLMRFEKDRMYLRCASCGHETPGWTLTEPAPKLVLRDPRRHALGRRPRLISARRIA